MDEKVGRREAERRIRVVMSEVGQMKDRVREGEAREKKGREETDRVTRERNWLREAIKELRNIFEY